MIKQIVLKVGRAVIDFCAWLEFIILLSILFGGTTYIWLSDFEMDQKIFITLGILLTIIVLFLVLIIFKYFMYLLIDIRDNTAECAKK